MAQRLILRAKGLHTHPNLISEVPDGALVVADDVVIDREGVIQPRRGFARMDGTVAGAIDRLWVYQDTLMLHHSDSTVAYRNGSSWTSLTGTIAAPSSTTSKMRVAEAKKNLYLTSSTGVLRLDAYNGTPVFAGVPRPPGFERDQRVATATAGNLVRATNVVTATTSAAHGFYIGQSVTQTSATEGDFIGGTTAGNTKTVVSVPSSTSFTYSETGADATSANPHTFVPAALVGSGAVLSDGNQAAYRVTFVSRDANGNKFESAPSPRTVIGNASGTVGYVASTTRNVVIRVFVPSTITNNDLIRVYRSSQTTTSIEPSEEMGLVWEAVVKPTEITNGWADITDVVPDALRGATGYFCPSQEGIEQSNFRPPVARDIAPFGGSMWFARTTGPERLTFNILGVGGTSGLQNGDAWFDAFDITMTTSTPTTAAQALIETSGGSASVNVRNTSLNLVAAINRKAINNSGEFLAFYDSGPDDAAGRITIEGETGGSYSRLFYLNGKRSAVVPVPFTSASAQPVRSGSTVTCTVSGGGTHSFLVGELVSQTTGSADFPTGNKTITAVTSTTFTYTETGAAPGVGGPFLYQSAKYVELDGETNPNRVYFSKTNQPEAVPLFNYIDMGSRDAEILRIVPTRSSLFVFKEDGLWRITGNNGSFSAQLFDPTVILMAPDSAVCLQNQVYALTTQGVVAVSDTGVDIVSRPIEKTITALQGQSLTNLKNYTFGVAYESERKYILWTIASSGDTTPTQAFVYNSMTQAWTRWVLSRRHAIVNGADDKLYLAETSGHSVSQERKAFTYADYADRNFTVTVNSESSGTTSQSLTLASASGVSVGDLVQQDPSGSHDGGIGVVTAINSNTLTVQGTGDYATTADGGTTVIYKAIPSVVQWAPVVGDSPGRLKTWQETQFLFANAHIPAFTSSVSTELNRTFDSTSVDAISVIGQWTLAGTAWDGVERPADVTLFLPTGYRMSDRLNLKVSVTAGWGVWAIDGIGVLYNPGSTRPAK